MKAIAVVQARMGSTRLPGKVLRPMSGRTVLALMLERLAIADVPVIVATSDRRMDDELAAAAARSGVEVVRGPEHDVLERFRLALIGRDVDHVVRLTADCPLVDSRIVRDALDLAASTDADYVSNSLIRTFPDGLDVEVIRAAALEEAASNASDPAEREHVTPYVYRRPERFSLSALVDDRRLGHLRWTIDTAEDLDRVRALADRLTDPVRASWTDVLEMDDTGRARVGLHLEPRLARDTMGPPSSPGSRTWLVADSSEVIGWLQVTVAAGVGTVDGQVDRQFQRAAIDLLRDALAADHQVAELQVHPLGGHSSDQ